MIKKVKGDAFTKNKLGLVYDKGIFEIKEKADQGKKSTPTQGENSTDPADTKSITPEDEKNADYKESSSNNLSKRLSTIKSEKIQAGEEELRKFLKALGKPGRKAAEKKIAELIQIYSRNNLAEAFWFVRKHGTLGTKEHCNFPLNYLSAAIIGVLEASGNDTQHQAVGEQINQSLGLQKATEEASKREEAEHWAKMEKLFEQAFSDRSTLEAFLAKIQKQFPQCDLNGRFVRSAAVQAWAAERSLN